MKNKKSVYKEFIALLKKNPDFVRAWEVFSSSGKDFARKYGNIDEEGKSALKALFSLLALFGYVTSTKTKHLLEVVSLVFVISLYLKRNILDDPEMKDFLLKAMNSVSKNGNRAVQIICYYIDKNVDAVRDVFRESHQVA